MAELVEVPCKRCGATGYVELRGPQLNAGSYGPCDLCQGKGYTVHTGPGCFSHAIFWILAAALVAAVALGFVLRAAGVIGDGTASAVLPAGPVPTKTAAGFEVGSCMADARTEARIVPCDQPHDLEVYGLASVDLPAGEAFPGQPTLATFATGQCGTAFEEYIGRPRGASALHVSSFVPDEQEWADGVRDVACTVSVLPFEELTPTTGSLEGSDR